MSPIIDMQRRMVEVGRIRMGKKDGNRPVKLDTFRLTSRDKTRLDEAAGLYGGTVLPWADREGEFELVTDADSLPILLIPGQALSQWYETWSAGGCQRRCDGVTEVLSDKPCVCDTESRDDRTCKPTTRLSVMLRDVPGLGCWRLESHGYYAAVELAATAGMLEQATARGQLLPARLRIDQRRQVKDGKTTRYAVPVIDIDIRIGDALAISAPVAGEIGYTPVAQRELAPITVEEGLAAAAASGTPKTTNGRSAAPIPAAGDDIEFGEPVPVPADDGPVKLSTKPQRDKLNVLVGKLRPEHVTTEQLYRGLGREPIVGVDGEIHWSALRDTLTRQEASELIERLVALEERVAA